MKAARLCLLIVLALLLPLRGALAQAVPCTGGHGSPAALSLQGNAHRHAHGHPMAAAHAPADAQAGDHGIDGHCSACATCCTGAAAASPVATFAPGSASAAQKFSSWSSPVPSVVPPPLERPPRGA